MLRSKTNILRYLALSLLVLGSLAIFRVALAQVDVGMAEIGNNISLTQEDPRTTVARIINISLSVLGLVALGLILWGGFIWMTAGGQEDKLEQAKKIIRNGVIGLLIILASWGIATFILNSILGATNNTGGSSACTSGQTLACGCGGGMTCIDGFWGPCLGSDCNSGGGPTSCDSNALLPGCQAADQICSTDSYCDADTCSCVPKGQLGDSCDGDDLTPTCEADNNLCGEYLSCGETSCVCEGQPVITAVSPLGGFCEEDVNRSCVSDSDCSQRCDLLTPNGTAGNLITIMGANFGAYDPINSQVLFAGAIPGISPSVVNPDCIDSWTNNQIVVSVPPSSVSGPLTVVASDGQSDTTSNEVGPALPDFLANNIVRPGLCLLTPESGRLSDKVNYFGINLFSGGQAYFGDYARNVRGLDSVFANPAGLVGTSTIPNLQKGSMSSFVVSSVSGVPQKSNYVKFIKQEEPNAGPYISYFEPATGRAGQYVTIHGGGFGGAKGESKVYFGDQEASYVFPEVCASSVWKDKQIIVKVPSELTDGNYQIKVDLSGVLITSENSNPNAFNVNSNESLKSSICKISPSRGTAGTPVTLWGEYFGETGSDGLAVFSRDQGVSGEITIDRGADSLNPAVPAQAVSGPVRVVKNGAWGNDVNFEIGTCSIDADCSGEVCCPAGTYKQGRCAPTLANCYINIPRSVFEWNFNTGFGTGIGEEEYDSCDGMAKALGACQINAFCPNSPGVCSPFAGAPRDLGPCDSSCASVPACIGNSCTYSATFDACILSGSSCSLNSLYTFQLGGEEFSANRSCNVFPQFGGTSHWQITTPTSCPSGWVRLDNNRCVDSVSATTSSCSICESGFNCRQNGTNSEGTCVSTELCAGSATCTDNKCIAVEAARCDCCCEVGQDARDCCAGLTCGGSCGSGQANLGECTGCTVMVGGVVDTAASDAACNCDKFSGKYCDTTTVNGNCGDCSRLSASDCLAHSATCCLNSKGTADPSDDVCTGGSGQIITSDENAPEFGYCAFYDCASPSSTPPGDPAQCASTTPTMYGEFSSISKCENGCEANPGGAACSQYNGDQAACGASAKCCYDFELNECVGGTDKTDDGYCAYYNCKAPPLDKQCETDVKLRTGDYKSKSECVNDCPYADIKPLPGTDCLSVSTFDPTCNTSFCGSPYACLAEGGGAGLPGGDCGACCCEVGNAASCSSLNTGGLNLVCKPDQAPCSGENRGLCCGCSADLDCGDLENVGCDSGTCCRARPAVVENALNPAHGASGVCRNAAINIPFDQLMDPASLTGNIILLEEHDYGVGICPAGTFVAALDGFTVPQRNWLDRLLARITRIKNVILNSTGLKSGSALAGIPDASKLYCSVPGTVTATNNGNRTTAIFTPKKLLAAGSNYFIVVKGDQALDSNSGVMSAWQLGMNGRGYLDLSGNVYVEGSSLTFNNLSFSNSYIASFATLPAQGANAGVCMVDYTQTDPSSYLFQDTANDLNENDTDPNNSSFDTKSDRDKVFTVRAFSSNGQMLYPTQGYFWDWQWHVVKSSIATIREVSGLANNRAFVETVSGVTDDSTMLRSTINMDRFLEPQCNPSSSCICAEPDCLNNCCNAYDDGDGLVGETPIYIFLCKNPWPPVNPLTQSWSPWVDTCAGAIGNCQSYNYKFYYCRDAGQDGFSDDLPAMINPAVIRGTGSSLICSEGRTACSNVGATCGPDNNFDGVGDGFCIWDVLKESYFFKESTPRAGAITAAVDEQDGETVRLEWNASSNLIYNANPAQMGRFRVYYAPANSGNMSFVDVKPTDIYAPGQGAVCTPATPASGQQYTCRYLLKSLQTNATYRFKVSAISAAQVESVLSNELEATVTDQLAPATPQGLVGTIQSGQRIRFTWHGLQSGVLFHRLYHGISSGQYGESFDSENGASSIEISSVGFSAGNHYFSLSALDASNNESNKSAEIVINLVAAP